MLGLGCRSWTCEICGPKRKALLVYRIVAASPTRFLTLTCRHEGDRATQLERITKALPRLITELRKKHGTIDYFRMLEHCKDGYPHFHLLLRCRFLPQPEIKRIWERLTGATIVDIRKAHGRSTGYVAKYLQKARDPDEKWSRQRISVSKHFWRTADGEADLIGWEHTREHPSAVAECTPATTYEREWVGRYIPSPRQPGDENPEELQPTTAQMNDQTII